MDEYKLPNVVETKPTYLVSFNDTVKKSLVVIEEKKLEEGSEHE